jgi:hypothetical protein
MWITIIPRYRRIRGAKQAASNVDQEQESGGPSSQARGRRGLGPGEVSSAAVATSREGQRSRRSGRAKSLENRRKIKEAQCSGARA